MYLEKLEIQGFKSFANKNTLKFVAAKKEKVKELGITAVVGPNGSGKSNIADAVRWVLGEQSVKLLRGKKSEDVIFSGSSKKASLSFAEVSLYLNNADKTAPIDFTDLVVTRRLYRDGESEYLLNGSRVRLLDVSLLLAKARFGQRAYSVIGQGMVENFLNTTLAERKEFFDEATGVKMYQIKRDDAMNKLQNARGNLAQGASLLGEIEPRMRSLTRQMKKLEQRAELERALQILQKNYYAAQWHKLNDELKEINKKLLEREKLSREEEKELIKINQDLDQRRSRQLAQTERQNLEEAKRKLETERNGLFQKLSEIKARIGVSYELSGKLDVAWLLKRETTLMVETEAAEKNIKTAKKELAELEQELLNSKAEQEKINKTLVELRERGATGQNSHCDAGALVSQTRRRIGELIDIYRQIHACLENGDNIADAKKYLSSLHAKLTELKEELKDNQGEAETESAKIKAEMIKLEEAKQAVVEHYVNLQGNGQGLKEKIKLMSASAEEKSKELAEIKTKLRETGGAADKENLKKAETEADGQLKKLNGELAGIDDNLAAWQTAGRREQEELTRRQKLLYELQANANEAAAKLNEIKIEKARVETKLEDLENEIRNETNNLRAIIDAGGYDPNLNKEETVAEMVKLKRQLELIGGIDPEVKKEYEETKTRFDFLFHQTNDLESGISSLEKITAELDKNIVAKFDKAFEEIAKHFEKYFKILFNGGSAKLLKITEDLKELEEKEQGESEENEDEPASVPSNSGLRRGEEKNKVILRQVKQVLTGIEIQATPPGKKIKSISMLSGGERALTAIALICAIISVNPSPFVVLDEVDAALDEANSARLSDVLEELSRKTQFIVITHNRSLMYKADVIYGVTMGENGVSQLLSLKVEEAIKK